MLKNVAKVLFSNAMLALVGLINSFLFPIILTVNEYAYYQQPSNNMHSPFLYQLRK